MFVLVLLVWPDVSIPTSSNSGCQDDMRAPVKNKKVKRTSSLPSRWRRKSQKAEVAAANAAMYSEQHHLLPVEPKR
jgi:hypothetical protein